MERNPSLSADLQLAMWRAFLILTLFVKCSATRLAPGGGGSSCSYVGAIWTIFHQRFELTSGFWTIHHAQHLWGTNHSDHPLTVRFCPDFVVSIRPGGRAGTTGLVVIVGEIP